jgi:NAD(P)-dependent dehydrogenase (short-subunit alcohol dehydrogenase family)
MTERFQDRIVVVTGAANGIGRAAARAFADEGGRVFLIDVDPAGSAVADELADASFITCDVTDEVAVAAAIERVAESADRIDVLVNNAGGFGESRGIEDTTLGEWRAVVDSNLTSVFLMARAALPMLKRSEAGRIVNVGSLAGQTAGWATAPPYVAAKGGVHALTRALAAELAPLGITANALAPSAVLTERITRLRDREALAATAGQIPLGRYQQPEEAAAWILFLASDEAGFMTGQTVSVNGGRFMA